MTISNSGEYGGADPNDGSTWQFTYSATYGLNGRARTAELADQLAKLGTLVTVTVDVQEP